METALSSDTAGGRTTIRLADGPGDVPADLHDRCAALLGRESFVDVAEILSKQRGRFVLTLEQLRDAGARR